jgi:hypothetical protein
MPALLLPFMYYAITVINTPAPSLQLLLLLLLLLLVMMVVQVLPLLRF